MRHHTFVLVVAIVWVPPVAATVDTGFIRLEHVGGAQISVACDASGQGHYGEATATLGPFRAVGGEAATELVDGFDLLGVPYIMGVGEGYAFRGPFDRGDDLSPTGSLGQSFTVQPGQGHLSGAWALLTCSGVDGSAVTLTIREGGPEGEVIAQERIQPIPEHAEVHLAVDPPVGPGTYYLEISEKHGGCYWWSGAHNQYADGSGYADGQPLAEVDRCFGFEVADVGAMDLRIRAEEQEIRIGIAPRESSVASPQPTASISFPWERAGYDTTDPARTPFDYALTDSGYWLPAEAFKRLAQDWALEPASEMVRLRGTHGYDLAINHARGKLMPRMDADRLYILVGDGAIIRIEAESDEQPEWMPRFFTSDPAIDAPLNEFLRTFLTSHTSCPSTYEFDALKLSWVGGPMRDSFTRVVGHYTYRVDEDGYIWSRGDARGWDGGDCSERDTRHYDNNPQFILACWRLYCMTGDAELLGRVLSTVRKATDYLLDAMDGRSGLLTIHSADHTGIAEPKGASWPSSYFDCVPAGYQDAYINAFYAPTLRAAAQLEDAAGDPERARELEELATKAEVAFHDAFWDDAAGRYIGWVDIDGGRHDFGMTYINTIAATHGLATAGEVARMFDWMQAQPTASGEPDTFSRWVFAPRSNTIHCYEQANNLKYDEWCEDGGAILWTAYYEIMARAMHLGADNAWARFLEILGRFSEPDHLVGGSPLYRGERNNHSGPPGSVGVWGEFPESGIAPSVFLYAFVGFQPDALGLTFSPRVPDGLEYVGVDGLDWRGHRLTVTAYRDRVEVVSGLKKLTLPIGPEGVARLDLDRLER